MKNLHAVTGAYGYSGRYIAKRLIEQGRDVITLTNSKTHDDLLRAQIPARPFHFDRPELLTDALRGVAVLYNTYWVRFNHPRFTYAGAVRNTRTLFRCAADAGVGRIVHISITNPSPDSPLEYFRGKAELEQALRETGIPHTILRPTVLFGREDILINNIAWALRRLPVFGLFGRGEYRLQPIYVDDLAGLAVEAGARSGDETINAVGPETFRYRDLVQCIAAHIGVRRALLPLPPRLAYAGCALLGRIVGDVVITRDEIAGLMAGLLEVDTPPTGKTRLTDWLHTHADALGRSYTSELARRSNGPAPGATAR